MQLNNRVRSVLGLMALVAVQAASAGCKSSSGSTPPTASKPSGAAAGYRYTLDQQLRVVTDHAEELASFDLKADLLLAKLGEQGGRTIMRAALEQPKLKAAGLAPDLQRDYEAGLLKACHYALDAQGNVVEVWNARGVPSAVQGIWKAMLSSLQLSRAQAERKETWQVTEHDGAGEYSAEYRRLGSGRFSKRKLSYADVPQAAAQPRQQVLETATTFKLDEGGDLASLDAFDKTRAELPSLPTFISESRLRLERKGSTSAAKVDDLSALLAEQASSRLSDPPSSDARRADADRDIAKNVTTSQLLPLLASKSQEERTQAYQRLVALLRIDDTAAAAVAKLARSQDTTADWAIAALGDSSTAETTKQLMALIRDTKLDASRRQTALQALGRAELQGKDGSEVALSLLSDPDLGFQAKLSIGSMIYRLKSSDAARARSLLTTLLAGAAGKTQRLDFLKALGNAGHPDSVETLGKLLGASNDGIRAGAAEALRRVPGDAAEALLLTAITDPSPQVRSAALASVQERKPSAKVVTAALRLAQTDSSQSVRIKAIGLIADFGRTEQTSAARDVLTQLANGADVDDAVRTSARRALERVGRAG